MFDEVKRLEADNLKLISENLARGREVISLQEQYQMIKDTLTSTSAELVIVRNENKRLRDEVDDARSRNTNLSKINDELEETNSELFETITTLKQCLKEVL